jgi:cullin-4
LKKLISDPANDSKMIDETLILKRFADRSIAGLFSEGVVGEATKEMKNGTAAEGDVELEHFDDEESEKTPVPIGFSKPQRKLELEDAVRKGFRAGMSSRENAPAEWIGG